MRKYVAMLCAAMLFVCCLALGACSNGGSASASASGSASAASASASSASAQASFAGDWKLAAVETQGITMAGDLEAVLGDGNNLGLVIKEDGTGTMTFGGETANFKWEQKDASTITITPEATSSSASSGSTTQKTADVTMKDGALFMALEEDSFTGDAIFTKDGTYDDAKLIKTADAKAITSADSLVGTWTLCGMNMMGISMYGDAKALSAMAGDTDTTLVFDKDGKVTMMGSDAQYTVGADGAAITEGSTSIPVKALGDDIMIDMSDMLGMEMVMVFSK